MKMKVIFLATGILISSSLMAQNLQNDTSKYSDTSKHKISNKAIKGAKPNKTYQHNNNTNPIDTIPGSSTTPNGIYTPGSNAIPNPNTNAPATPNTPSVEPNRSPGNPPAPAPAPNPPTTPPY